MKLIHPLRSLLPLACMIATAAASWSQVTLRDEPPLDPSTVTSRSGAWSLHIEPLDRMGETSAHYALTHDNQEVWSGNRIYALRNITVTETGIVTGWSMTERNGNTNHVVIFDAKGSVLLDRSWDVAYQSCMTVLDEHSFNGCIAVPDADRLIARTRIEERTGTADVWQTYRLSTGEPLVEARPAGEPSHSEQRRREVKTLAVPDTPLVIVQWLEWGGSDWQHQDEGTRYTLLDMSLQPVWTLDLPKDFNSVSDEERQALRERVWREGMIVGTQAGGRFQLDLVADAQRATGEARAHAAGSWVAHEISRTSTKPETAADTKQPAIEVPTATISHLAPIGVVDLLASDPPVPEIHSISNLTVDDAGNPVFFRYRYGSHEIDVMRVSPEGARLSGATLTAPDEEGYAWDHLCWLPGDRVIVGWKYGSKEKSPAHTDLYEVSLASGERRRLPTRLTLEMRGLERMPDGGFVVLGDNVLTAFDDQGNVTWTRTSAEKLCGAYEMTVQPSGRIVLSEGGGNKGIQYVLPDGSVRAYMQLVPAKGHEVPYLSSLTSDVEGRLVLEIDGGFCTVDAQGQLSTPVKVTTSDGRRIECGDPVSDGHGRFWANSNRTLVRFDAEGKIDRMLGDPLVTDALREIDSARVTEDGTVHVLSNSNRLIARIDSDGKRSATVHLVGPGFDDHDLDYHTALAVGHDGSTWISPDRKSWIAFGPDGARHDLEWAAGTPTIEPMFQIGRDRCWIVTGEKLLLAQRDGTVVRTIDKDPKGRWLSPLSSAVALDGSIAFECERNTKTTSTFEILDAEGNAPRVIETQTPSDAGIAWDGREIAFVSHESLHLLDVESGHDREFVLDQPGRDALKVQSVTFVRGGREVWIYAGEQRVYRYPRP